MTNTFCYSGYGWRVVKNNKFIGYVVALSEWDAVRKAEMKFGKNIFVERVIDPTYNK